MGTLYRISRTTHGQSTSADSITIDIPAGRMLVVHQAEVTGAAAAAAAAAEIGIFRTTANGSGGTPTSLTIKNVDANPDGTGLPSGFTAKFGYSTPPTIEADPIVRMVYQPLGGKGRYMALPGGAVAFWKATAYQVSLRGIVGTPQMAVDFIEVELF
jgi:hypothetical protein